MYTFRIRDYLNYFLLPTDILKIHRNHNCKNTNFHLVYINVFVTILLLIEEQFIISCNI